MLQNDGFNEWLIAFERSDTQAAQFAIIEFLGHAAIFFPPSTNRAHVMSGWRHDAKIGSIFGMKKFAARIFRHALNFKTQQAEIFHHLRNASGNEAEVFTTNEHVSNAFQGGQ